MLLDLLDVFICRFGSSDNKSPNPSTPCISSAGTNRVFLAILREQVKGEDRNVIRCRERAFSVLSGVHDHATKCTVVIVACRFINLKRLPIKAQLTNALITWTASSSSSRPAAKQQRHCRAALDQRGMSRSGHAARVKGTERVRKPSMNTGPKDIRKSQARLFSNTCHVIPDIQRNKTQLLPHPSSASAFRNPSRASPILAAASSSLATAWCFTSNAAW